MDSAVSVSQSVSGVLFAYDRLVGNLVSLHEIEVMYFQSELRTGKEEKNGRSVLWFYHVFAWRKWRKD